jgi:hypothetical protein
MKITVYVFDENGDEVGDKDKLEWYPSLEKAVRKYISLFNNLPQIGIEFAESDNLDPLIIKRITINPISEKIIVCFDLLTR